MSDKKKPKKPPVNKATGKPLTEEEILRRRRARKRREMKRKKQRQKAFLLIVFCVIVLGGAVFLLTRNHSGKFDEANETTLSLTSEGAIYFEEIIEAGEEMTEKELEDFIKGEIKDYNTGEESSISLEKVRISQGRAYVRIRYKDVATYSDFTGYDVFYGGILDAQRKGYAFTSQFAKVETRETEEGTLDYKITEVTRDEALSDSQANVFIIQESVRVVYPGTLSFISSEGTKCEDGCVRIFPVDGNSDSAPLTYLIFAKEEAKENK